MLVGDNFGTNLRPFWDHFDAKLSPFDDLFLLLGLFWGPWVAQERPESPQGRILDHFGAPFWDIFVSRNRCVFETLFLASSVVVLVPFWRQFGGPKRMFCYAVVAQYIKLAKA